jgi:SAM-dependent methyltransferase
MDSRRIEGVARLTDRVLKISDPSYLVHRRLFADLETASRFATGRLLDIGCGNKPYASLFMGKITEHLGCDIVQSSEQRVDIICPATAIPLDDASVDTILCTQVIEHVSDHRALLQEIRRLLRSGGILILSGPMYWPLHEEPHDFFRFTKYGFRSILEAAGLSVASVESNGGKWALCGQVLIHTLAGTVLSRKPFTSLINRLFSALDDRYKGFTSTINYVVVAQKP